MEPWVGSASVQVVYKSVQVGTSRYKVYKSVQSV
jgi:hypothetical protein